MIKEFPSRQWKIHTLNNLIKRIDETGSSDRKWGSGRSWFVHMLDYIAIVYKLISSQETASGGHMEYYFD